MRYAVLGLNLTLALLAGFAGCGNNQVSWKLVIDTGVEDSACALVGDEDYLYVVGSQSNPQTGRSVWLIQTLTRKGEPIRRAAIAEGSAAIAGDATMVGAGLYICGSATVHDTGLCLVSRVRPAGAALWKRGLVVGEQSSGSGICPVRGGRLAVCGSAVAEQESHVLVALLDTCGRTIWSRTYDLGSFSAGCRLVADSASNLFVTGRCGTPESPDVFVMRLEPDGDTVWTRRYDSGGDDFPGDVALGQLGYVLATGTARVNDSTRCVVLSYSPSGELSGQMAYGASAQAEGHAIAATPDGRYFVTGRLITPKGSSVHTFQYLADALSVWQRTVQLGSSGTGVAVRVEDQVYVAATVRNATRDIAVLSLTLPPAGR
jgi:hypothetical protein